MNTIFIKETDKKGTSIIEGEAREKNVFAVKRFICDVQKQETEKETQEVADMLLKSLNKKKKVNDFRDAKEFFIKNNFEYFTPEQLNVIGKTMVEYVDFLQAE
jgi:hypothetical protein